MVEQFEKVVTEAGAVATRIMRGARGAESTLCGIPGAMNVTFPIVASISTWGAHNIGQPGSDCISVVSAGQAVGVVFYLNGGSQQQAQYGAYDLQCFVNYAADGVRWDNSPLPRIDPGGGPIVVGSVVTALGNPDGIIQVLLVTPPPPPEVASPIGTPGQVWLLYCGAEQIRNFSNPDVPLVNWLAHGLLPATAPVAQVATGGSIIADDQIRLAFCDENETDLRQLRSRFNGVESNRRTWPLSRCRSG